MEGCLLDVSLAVKLYPNLEFQEVAVLYGSQSEAGDVFRKKYDQAKAVYLKKKECRGDEIMIENSCDVRRTTTYGALDH